MERKIRWLFAIIWLFHFPFLAEGQYSNEWIVFSQSYYKIPVAKDGIYRLTHANLSAAGVPVASIDPRRIQIFHRGIEQSIFIQGQADASFDPSDYLEFYGKKNDGTLDADLYKPASFQPHTYYNLYSDTTSYFLTWNNSLTQGKRVTQFSELNVTNLPKEVSHNFSRLSILTNEYSGGNTLNVYQQYTHFDEGEGWTGSVICLGNSGCTGFADYVIDQLSGGVPSEGNPQLEVMIVGRDALNHQAEVWVGPTSSSLRLVDTKLFTNYQTSISNVTINWTDIGADGRMTVQVRAIGVGGVRDRLSVMYSKVTLPQNFNMNTLPEKTFNLNAGAVKSYIEIVNPASNSKVWDITDSENIVSIGTVSTSVLSAVIPNTLTARKLYVTNTFSTPSIVPIKFRQIDASSHNFIIISNRILMQPALGYSDPVKAYGGYRASVDGGSYDTLVVTMDQLYNQFNFGEVSPRAIFKFSRYMYEQGDPKYLFLIGKGLGVYYNYHRKTSFVPGDLHDLVPTAGNPGSDMSYTVGLGNTTYEPAIPTGRITASTPTHVAQYLNKIKEHEVLPFNESWRRDILHLSGGIQPAELTTFLNYMNGFKNVAEGRYLGGRVSTIAKQKANPVELINISDEVNNGLNLITFFGHSSPSTIDIDVGFVTDPTMGYNNKGKYPSFLINGCNAGLFFLNGTLFGEDWILANEKGAKSFIAHSSYGFSSTLKLYSDFFYEVGYGDSVFVKKGIGDVQKEVARRYMASTAITMSNITQVQQMVLLGDPAVKLFGATKPDYETNDGAITIESFDGKPITALTDSFAVKAIVRNFGIAPQDTLTVRLTRTFSDNSTVSFDSIFSGALNQDTILLTVYRGDESSFGNNEIQILLDPENKIDELSKTNNSGRRTIFIPLNGTLNLFPKSFSIVSTSSLNLVWQNTDLLSSTRNFLLELDTVNTFDSPFLTRSTISGKVVASKSISLLSLDSLAYYWRTRLEDPLPGESVEWTTSSFAFINNSSEGWTQLHFPQLYKNPVSGLSIDSITRKVDFLKTITGVDIHTYGSNHPAPHTSVSIKINDSEYNLSIQGVPCRDNTINLVAFDKSSAVPYAGIPFIFQDPRTCGRSPQLINSFRSTELETGNGDDLFTYIDNLDVSDSVILFSIGDPLFSSWSSTVLNKLGEIGISQTQITSLTNGEPLVIHAKKGAPSGSANVFRTSSTPVADQELVVSSTITGSPTSGTMFSSLVGPALSWEEFVFRLDDVEPSDQFNFSIIGVDQKGLETTLQSGITGTFNLSGIDAIEYPYLKIKLTVTDEVLQTPIQLKKWFVFYESPAEGMLVYKGLTGQESVAEGEAWSSRFGFTNISSRLFSDSVTVKLEVFNKAKSSLETSSFKVNAPIPGDTTFFDVSTSTIGKVGLNDLQVFVNQRILAEQYYDNNVIELREQLNVIADIIPPVLDVTIDGRYVSNGDYVSRNPSIQIQVIDENPFLLKKDTVGVILFLAKGCAGSQCIQPIYLSDPDLSWYPADEQQSFRLEYLPELDTGHYTLLVQATDVSGNLSGEDFYSISFIVSDEDLIVFYPPYPIPSSEKVIFKFQIAGNEQPDDFSLRILSMNGEVVQEYTAGSSVFRVGTNYIEWNARDAYGNLLPNGLYVYQLVLSSGGQTANQAGKIVITR